MRQRSRVCFGWLVVAASGIASCGAGASGTTTEHSAAPQDPCATACARMQQCGLGTWDAAPACRDACVAADDSPGALATFSCVGRATDCAQASACEGAQPHDATAGGPAAACARACARIAECGIGSFGSSEGCQTACTSAPEHAEPGRDLHAVFECLAGADASQCDMARACQLRAIAALAPPEQVSGGTVDARALVSPIRALLQWWLVQAETDQAGAAVYGLVLVLVDSRDAERHIGLGTVSMPQSESIIIVEPAPMAPRAPLFEDRRFFAGAGDDYLVEQVRATIVVKHRSSDEEDSGTGRWVPMLRIDLARGVTVEARSAR